MSRAASSIAATSTSYSRHSFPPLFVTTYPPAPRSSRSSVTPPAPPGSHLTAAHAASGSRTIRFGAKSRRQSRTVIRVLAASVAIS